MGATLFLGLTFVALITQGEPETVYANPKETMHYTRLDRAPRDMVRTRQAAWPAPVFLNDRDQQTDAARLPAPSAAGRAVEARSAAPAVPALVTDVAGFAPIAAAGVMDVMIAPRPSRQQGTASQRLEFRDAPVSAIVARGADPYGLSMQGLGIVSMAAPGPAPRPGPVDAAIRPDPNLRPSPAKHGPAEANPVFEAAPDRVTVFGAPQRAMPEGSVEMPGRSVSKPAPALPRRASATSRAVISTDDRAPVPQPGPERARVDGDGVFLRVAPALNAETVGQYDRDTIARIYEERGRWLRVEIEGQYGWMFGRYLAPPAPDDE